MENHGYADVVGSSAAPYLNSLAAACGLATNYHNITHPSLPNYIGATSGLGLAALAPFRSDCEPSASCSTSGASIFSQVPGSRAYEESMPSPCDRHSAGRYAARHNPPVYFTALGGCAQRDVPLPQLSGDLARDALPGFAFITPNLCHDAHDCSLSAGDRWLSAEVPRILDSPAYRAGHTALFITWDEGEGSGGTDCATSPADPGCRVATVVVSPSTPRGVRVPQPFTHYSLLRTAEDLLGVQPLGQARSASSMARPFGL